MDNKRFDLFLKDMENSNYSDKTLCVWISKSLNLPLPDGRNQSEIIAFVARNFDEFMESFVKQKKEINIIHMSYKEGEGKCMIEKKKKEF